MERDKAGNLEEQLRPRIAVSIEHEPVGTGGSSPIGEAGRFWRLKVVNTSTSPISRCYGEIVHCYAIKEDGSRINNLTEPWPREGHGLPWARQSGGTYEIPLGGDNGTAYLDYIMVRNKHSGLLHIPSRPNPSQDRPNYTDYFVGYDNLEFQIAVGSYEESMKRTIIRFVFKWLGGYKAEITELRDTTPQGLDKEGSQTK